MMKSKFLLMVACLAFVGSAIFAAKSSATTTSQIPSYKHCSVTVAENKLRNYDMVTGQVVVYNIQTGIDITGDGFGLPKGKLVEILCVNGTPFIHWDKPKPATGPGIRY